MNEKNLAIVFVPALALSNAQLFNLILTEQEMFFESDSPSVISFVFHLLLFAYGFVSEMTLIESQTLT